MKTLEGQVAIVTGAAHPQGIGRAIAQKLAQQGAQIVVVDLASAEGFDTAAAELRDYGIKAVTFACDVSRRQEVRACIDHVKETFGRIDLLVNNAGVGRGAADFLELSDSDWDISYQVNLKGVANFCQAVLPQMLEQGQGNIINVASLAGLGAIEAIPACYTATKFAVVGLTKQLAVNYARHNIRCNAVCPGSVVTQMHAQTLQLIADENQISIEEAQQLEDASIPMGYSAQPGQIGDAVVYLASPAASYITGVSLPVAGGMMPGL